MKKKMVVGPVLTPDWLEKRRGIMAEFDRQLILGVQGSGKGLTLDQLQLVTEHRNPFEVAAVTASAVDEMLADWIRFYRDVFEIDVDFTDLKVPERQPGFDRLIVVKKGMSPESVYKQCNKFFSCFKYTDRSLDDIVFDVGVVGEKYRRSDHENYAVWVRDRIEADQELKFCKNFIRIIIRSFTSLQRL